MRVFFSWLLKFFSYPWVSSKHNNPFSIALKIGHGFSRKLTLYIHACLNNLVTVCVLCRWQTKPKMTIHGDLYYEGKEFETRLREKKPGDLSDELRRALGMPTGMVRGGTGGREREEEREREGGRERERERFPYSSSLVYMYIMGMADEVMTCKKFFLAKS